MPLTGQDCCGTGALFKYEIKSGLPQSAERIRESVMSSQALDGVGAVQADSIVCSGSRYRRLAATAEALEKLAAVLSN